MLHILWFFRVLAVRECLLSSLLNVCERERKTRCNKLRGILHLKDRVQLHTHTHTLPQLFVSHKLLQSFPGLFPPVLPQVPQLPSCSCYFYLWARGSRGPLHGLITASSDKPLPSYFNQFTSTTASFVFHLHPPRLLARSSGNILGNDKQRKSATQKQAATRQTTEQLVAVWSAGAALTCQETPASCGRRVSWPLGLIKGK